MMEKLKEHLLNPYDKNHKIVDILEGRKMDSNKWYAGDQLNALRYYFDNTVKIISTATDGNYQGTYFAILLVNDRYFLWRDSFGSCSGCDAIEGLNEKTGYDYIEKTLTSAKEFETLEEIWEYLKKPEDCLYTGSEIHIGEVLIKNLGEIK